MPQKYRQLAIHNSPCNEVFYKLQDCEKEVSKLNNFSLNQFIYSKNILSKWNTFVFSTLMLDL